MEDLFDKEALQEILKEQMREEGIDLLREGLEKDGDVLVKYPYMTLDDNTEITHSSLQPDQTVLVYIETPVYGGFHHATCMLPAYQWVDIVGYSDEEIEDYTDFLHHNAHLIIEFAAEGGFLNAAAV